MAYLNNITQRHSNSPCPSFQSESTDLVISRDKGDFKVKRKSAFHLLICHKRCVDVCDDGKGNDVTDFPSGKLSVHRNCLHCSHVSGAGQAVCTVMRNNSLFFLPPFDSIMNSYIILH